MSYHSGRNGLQRTTNHNPLVSNNYLPAPCHFRRDSVLAYTSCHNYKVQRLNKRPRADEDEQTLEGEASRKIRVTEEIWRQESARYGIIPAAVRHAIRQIRNALSATASLTYPQIEAACHAILDYVSGSVEAPEAETSVADDSPSNSTRRDSQLSRSETPAEDYESPACYNCTSAAAAASSFPFVPLRLSPPTFALRPLPPLQQYSPPRQQYSPPRQHEPLSDKPEDTQACPACTFLQSATNPSCDLCDTILLVPHFTPRPTILQPKTTIFCVQVRRDLPVR